jgi:perosamine synthetase
MKLIPWAKPKVTIQDRKIINNALRSGWISHGSYVEKFENKLKNFLKVKYASSVSNGTAALQLAFLSLGLKRGDEILCPSYCYMAAANIATQMFLNIKFIDVEKNSFCLSLNSIKKNVTKKTKAVVVVHTYGNTCEIDSISRFLKKRKIFLIEDTAEALGSKYKNKYLGAFGDISTISFHSTKSITTGEGGAIVTNNKEIYEKAKLLRNHGVKNKRYYHNVPGFNFRISNILCALGYSQLKRLNKIKKKRKKIFYFYLSNIDKKKISVQNFSKNIDPLYWTFSMYIKEKKYKRDNLISFLQKNNIETRNGFYSSNYLKYFKKNKKLINSDFLSRRVINLPIFEELKIHQQKFIINKVNSFFNG